MNKKLNKKLEKAILLPICVADAAIGLAVLPVLVGAVMIKEGMPKPKELIQGYVELSKTIVEQAFDIMED